MDAYDYRFYYKRTIQQHATGLKLGLGGTGFGKTSTTPKVVAADTTNRKYMYVANRVHLLNEMAAHLTAAHIKFVHLQRDVDIVVQLLQHPQLRTAAGLPLRLRPSRPAFWSRTLARSLNRNQRCTRRPRKLKFKRCTSSSPYSRNQPHARPRMLYAIPIIIIFPLLNASPSANVRQERIPPLCQYTGQAHRVIVRGRGGSIDARRRSGAGGCGVISEVADPRHDDGIRSCRSYSRYTSVWAASVLYQTIQWSSVAEPLPIFAA